MTSLKHSVRTLATMTVFAASIAVCLHSNATTYLWNVATPGPNSWNVNANWTPNTGNPGPSDTATFGTNGASPDALTVNNIVSANTVVSGLSYINTNGGTWDVTQIPAPNRLTVTNNFAVGGLTADGIITTVAMIGDGTFEADSPAFTVGNAGSAGTSVLNATLDMSGLSNFVYFAPTGTWVVAGSGSTTARAGGLLNLAGASNNITVGTINFNVGGGNNSGFHSLIQLGGGTNIFNVGTFIVCQTKAQYATVQFLPGVPATAGLRIRGTNGATDDNSRATITLGDRNNTGTANTDGEMLLNGNPVDIKAGTLTIGQDRSSSTSATHGGIGVLQFDTGTVDATNIIMANCTTADPGAPSATGTLTVGANGTLLVGNGGISLANQVHGTATGNLNIFGTAICSNSIIKATSNGTGANLTITSGKLTMVSGTIGTPAAPIDNLNLTTATLTLPVLNNSTNIVVNNFNPVDTATVISISSLPVLTSYPSQFPLITYSALAGGGSVSLGTLPSTFQGYITNDTSVNTVFLFVTNGPSTSKLDQWTGSINSTWDTSTLNWTSSGLPAAYAENDSVAFDDTASTGTINYSATHTPFAMAFANSSLNYTLGGTGKITGLAGLVQSGSGSVTLTASGGDNFSGGITVNSGSVILDDANSAISGALTVVGGATFQVGNNDANGNIPSASIANDGTIIIDRTDNLGLNTSITGAGSLVKIGNGSLTLSNASPYFGNTLVSGGTLALAGAGSLTNSPSIVVSNAILDLSGVSSGIAMLSNLSVNNSVLTLGGTNVQAPLTVSSLIMGGSANTINVSALPPVASYPSTVTLVQSPGGISGYNAVLGTLPAGSVGTLSLSPDTTMIQLTLASGPIGTRTSVFWTGSDVPNLNTNWSDRLNWQLPGAPTPSDNVIFGDVATVSDALTIDNIVDTSTILSSLRYTNSLNGQWHVTQIPTGVTLTVTNFTVGGITADNFTTSVAMTDGGTLLTTGSSFNVGNGGSSASLSSATLDLSALSNFVYQAPAGTFNIGNNGARSIGNMNFAAASNSVTAGIFNFEASAASSSVTATINLGGGTNILNFSTNNIGAQRSSGTLQFPGTTGGIRWRGVSGADSDRAYMTLGLRSAGGTSGTSGGKLFFNDHPVDMKLATLIMGQETASGSPITADGEIQFTMGTIDATTINMAICSGNSGASSTATMTVGTNATFGLGATLIVGTGGISLVNQTLGTSTANLNVTGGTLVSSGNIIKTTLAGSATVTINSGGTVKMLAGVIGTPAAPIDILNLDTATLQLKVDGSSPVTNIVANTLTAADTSTINISSVANITAPATVSLISYVGTDPYPNLVLGSLPSGVAATLVDDTANSTIDLSITSVPVTVPPTINNISIIGGNIVISGTNNSGAGGTYHVLTSTNLLTPLTNWTVATNGSFDGSGNFNSTNAIDPTKPSGFYLLQVP